MTVGNVMLVWVVLNQAWSSAVSWVMALMGFVRADGWLYNTVVSPQRLSDILAWLKVSFNIDVDPLALGVASANLVCLAVLIAVTMGILNVVTLVYAAVMKRRNSNVRTAEVVIEPDSKYEPEGSYGKGPTLPSLKDRRGEITLRNDSGESRASRVRIGDEVWYLTTDHGLRGWLKGANLRIVKDKTEIKIEPHFFGRFIMLPDDRALFELTLGPNQTPVVDKVFESPVKGEQIVMVSRGTERYGRVAERFEKDFFYHDIDTIPGDSGALIYNVRGQVVAMHVGDAKDKSANVAVLLPFKDGTYQPESSYYADKERYLGSRQSIAVIRNGWKYQQFPEIEEDFTLDEVHERKVAGKAAAEGMTVPDYEKMKKFIAEYEGVKFSWADEMKQLREEIKSGFAAQGFQKGELVTPHVPQTTLPAKQMPFGSHTTSQVGATPNTQILLETPVSVTSDTESLASKQAEMTTSQSDLDQALQQLLQAGVSKNSIRRSLDNLPLPSQKSKST